MSKSKNFINEKLSKFGWILRYAIFGGSCIILAFSIFVMSFSIFNLLYGLDFTATVMGTRLIENSVIFLIGSSCSVLVGCLIGILAFLFSNRPFFLLYTFILVLGYLMAVASFSLAIVFRTWVSDQMRNYMRNTLQYEYGMYTSYAQQVTRDWDLAQRKWYCCGVEDESWGVYRSSNWYSNQSGNPDYDKPYVPESCCLINQYGESINTFKCQTYISGPPGIQSGVFNEALYYQGCFEAGRDTLFATSAKIIAISITFSISLMAELFFLFWLNILLHV